MDHTNEEIVNLNLHHYYKLKDHESYFNWIDDQFDMVKAQDTISSRQCPKACSDMKECKFCCLTGEWRQHVEPFPFLDGDDDQHNKDQGHFHEFVSSNSEMAFLETFTGEYEKAKNRLEYLNSAIECVGKEHRLDFFDGYKYMTATLGAYIQFCKLTLNRSDVASLQFFKDLSPQAQIGVLSLKFLFCKEMIDSVKIQIPILRKLIELDPKNAVWHESLGLRLRVIKNASVKYRQKMEKCSSEQTTAFTTAYNLRPDIPRFFASFSRNLAETWKENRYQSITRANKIEVLEQSFETVEGVLNFLKSNTSFLLEAVDDIESKTDTAYALSTMGEVFSVSLPKPFQDLELAEKCISSAVRICPTSSKSNHRMGLFQFIMVIRLQVTLFSLKTSYMETSYLLQRHNFDTGLKHLTVAVGSKTENFYAVVDWIQLLIHKYGSKSEILIDIFENIFATDFKWTAGQTARLVFLKGCFNFVFKGDKTETMDSWIEAYKTDGTTPHFSVAFNEARRFRWKGFDAKEILSFLTTSKLKSTPTVRAMINEIRDRGATSKQTREFNKAKLGQK